MTDTTETPMRERIARAIHAKRFGATAWENWVRIDASLDEYFGMADAVLDAMREPTKWMIEAAYKAPMLGGFKSQYQSAIDAAKEGK